MIHVYIADTKPFRDYRKFEQGCLRVDPARLEKIKACRCIEDRLRSLCAGLLLQYAVKHETGMDNSVQVLPLCYDTNESGKPYLCEYPELFFSLSHSGSYAALSIGNMESGLDIQQQRRTDGRIAGRVFTEEEKRCLEEAATAEEREFLFFRLWTAKESYGKLTGRGFFLDPRSYACNPETGQAGEDGVFRHYLVENGYHMSVCLYREYDKELPKDWEDVTYLL